MRALQTLLAATGILAASLGAASAQIYNWTTIAGLAGQPGSADGTNSAARFRRPQGLAADFVGNVYVADGDNSTIRKITPVGTNWGSTTIAGLAGSAGNADGTNSAARFNHCGGVAVDPDRGNVFVADTFNHTIRMLTPSGTNWVVTTIAGQAGSAGSEDGTNGTARFSNPSGIAVAEDSGRNVFVADTGNSTIRQIALSGTSWVVRTLAGLARTIGSADGTNSAARFQWPSALGVRTPIGGLPPGFHDYVFVADTWNSNIREFDFYGEGSYIGNLFTVRTVAGLAGKLGSDDGTNNAATFFNPGGVAADFWSGDVFVADSYNNTIRKLTPVGSNWVVSTIGGLPGNPGYVDGPSSAARFYGPQGIGLDDYGRVFVADAQNHTIRMGVLVPPPVLQSVTLTNGILSLIWSALSGCSYEVQYKTNLIQPDWNTLGVFQATGSTATESVAAVVPGQPTDRQRFFRVVLLP